MGEVLGTITFRLTEGGSAAVVALGTVAAFLGSRMRTRRLPAASGSADLAPVEQWRIGLVRCEHQYLQVLQLPVVNEINFCDVLQSRLVFYVTG